jgi:hypothetical protein
MAANQTSDPGECIAIVTCDLIALYESVRTFWEMGFTEIFLHNPTTGERIPVTLETIRGASLPAQQ